MKRRSGQRSKIPRDVLDHGLSSLDCLFARGVILKDDVLGIELGQRTDVLCVPGVVVPLDQ